MANSKIEPRVSGLNRRASLPLAFLVIALCFLLHPYYGIIHDARLYTLQALNFLSPELYASDVFLRYGSQDSYTIFTPIYACVVSMLGAELAASISTFASICLLILSAWVLAKTIATADLAWLGVGFLVVSPAFYGYGTNFSIVEGFITPRMIAEALSLLAIAFWLQDRRWLAAILVLGALVIHPIMAFPAIVLILVLWWNWRNWCSGWSLVAGIVLLVATALALSIPRGQWQFDPEWWRQTQYTDILFPSRWTLHDWARIGTVCATLLIGSRCLTATARKIAIGTLVTTSALLLLSVVGGDILRIVLVVQGQAWRALWLATAIALLLLPMIAASCWRGGPIMRCALLLLLSAWIAGPLSLSILLSVPAAIIALWGGGLPRQQRLWRMSLLAASVVMGVVLVCTIAVAWLSANSSTRNRAPGFHGWFEYLQDFCEDGIVPTVVLVLVWHLSRRLASRVTAGVIVAALGVPSLALANPVAAPWFTRIYTPEVFEAFAPWREVIPVGSDVLWASRLFDGHEPSGAWLLLQRPSYYSSVQANSGLFSRAAAMEFRQRGRSIPPELPTELPFKLVIADHDGMPVRCADAPTEYIVSETSVEGGRSLSAPPGVPTPFDRLKLHICS